MIAKLKNKLLLAKAALFLVIVVALGMCAYKDGYRQGNIDAQNHVYKYSLQEQADGEVRWKRND